jgi:hypothetical protein
MDAPLYRRPPLERARAARAAVDHLARVTVHPLRRTDTDPFVVTGRVLSVAALYGGVGSDVLVLVTAEGRHRAFSLSIVAAVEVVS